jgi:hypothetical protein
MEGNEIKPAYEEWFWILGDDSDIYWNAVGRVHSCIGLRTPLLAFSSIFGES